MLVWGGFGARSPITSLAMRSQSVRKSAVLEGEETNRTVFAAWAASVGTRS